MGVDTSASTRTSIEVRRLEPEWSEPLAAFFQELKQAGDEKQFHPHPLTAEEARVRAEYEGKDLYYVLTEGRVLLGYGMLRGWDEGFDVPSLGIAIRPSARGRGLGRLFMEALHAAARSRKADSVRLKVHPDNRTAITLYESLGYVFEGKESGQCVGVLSLVPAGLKAGLKIPVAEPNLQGREAAYVQECLRSSWISSRGVFIRRFEEAFAGYVGVEHAVSVCNGTAALHLLLSALGIKAGDEVIVPALTYVASATSVVHAGATPVFCDVDPVSWNLTAKTVEAVITEHTRAVMAVHLYGNPVEMAPLRALCKKHKLLLVEDAAEALGAEIEGQKAGSFGEAAGFSFFGNKTLSTGEGGMVTTQSAGLAALMRKLKNQGEDPKRRYWYDRVGYNYRMTNIEAAIGLAQIERVGELVARKRAIAKHYREALHLPQLTHAAEREGTVHAQWMSSFLLPESASETGRDSFMSALAKRDIETRPFFPSLSKLPIFQSSQKTPVSESLSVRGVNLPSATTLTDEQLDVVCQAVRDALKEIQHG